MSQRLPDPNQPLTISILRDALEKLEVAGHGDTPISLHAGNETQCLIQAHNILPDKSVVACTQLAELGFGSTWDATRRTGIITNFVIL